MLLFSMQLEKKALMQGEATICLGGKHSYTSQRQQKVLLEWLVQ